MPWSEQSDVGSTALGTALTPTLTANRRLALPLPLGAGLLVEAALPKLGIESRPLHFALETTQCTLKALVVLNGHFQRNHAPQQRKQLCSLVRYVGAGRGVNRFVAPTGRLVQLQPEEEHQPDAPEEVQGLGGGA